MSIEEIIYLAVRIVCTLYLFYDLWMFLFRRRINGLWDGQYDKVGVNKVDKSHDIENNTPDDDDPNEVIGKSKIIYYLDSEAARKNPTRSLELRSIEIEVEDDINPDDVEDDFVSQTFLTEDDRLELMNSEGMMPDPDFDTSLTFEEMSDIVDVLKSDSPDERKSILAATTIHHKLADTVIFDFLVNKVSNEDRVNRLLGECLDENGKPLAKRRKTTRTMAFDIEKYA